jgi:hypothetical protein
MPDNYQAGFGGQKIYGLAHDSMKFNKLEIYASSTASRDF